MSQIEWPETCIVATNPHKIYMKIHFFFDSWLTNSSANAACGSIKHNWSPANLIRCSNDWLAQQEQNSCLATNGLCGQPLTRVKSVRTWGRVLFAKSFRPSQAIRSKFNQSCLLSLGSAANARKLIKTKLQWFDNCYQENVPLSRQLNVNINKQRNWLIHETNKRWAV